MGVYIYSELSVYTVYIIHFGVFFLLYTITPADGCLLVSSDIPLDFNLSALTQAWDFVVSSGNPKLHLFIIHGTGIVKAASSLSETFTAVSSLLAVMSYTLSF